MSSSAASPLNVLLNRPDGHFQPGEAISGYVQMMPNPGREIPGLEVALEWTARGSKEPTTTTVHLKQVSADAFEDGAPIECPFAFIAPFGPQSVQAHGVDIAWHVTARAVETPSSAPSQLLKASAPLYLGRPESTADGGDIDWDHGQLAAQPGPKQEAGKDAPSALSNLGVGLLVTAVVATVLALGTPSSLAAASLFLVAIGLAGLGLAGLWWAHRNAVASQKTGTVTVSPSPLTGRAGEPLQVRVQFPVLKPVTLNRVDITLRGETLDLELGGEPSRIREFFVKDARPVDRSARDAGEAVDEVVTFEVPADALLTLESSVCAIRWSIEVHIDIPQWPDFVGVWPVTIGPSPRAAVVSEEPASDPIEGSRVSTRSRLSKNCGPNDWEVEVESEVVSGSAVEPEGSEAATGRDRPPSVTGAVFRQPQSEGELWSASELSEAIETIARATKPSEREATIASLRAKRFELAMMVEERRPTTSVGGHSAKGTVDGQTVMGALEGSPYTIALRLPPTCDQDLESMNPGDTLRARAQPSDWNVLYGRLELDGELVQSP